MARMIPELNDVQLGMLSSQAEAKFYRACRDQLDDAHLVLHSVQFIRPDPEGGARDGEADFLIFHPRCGFLVVEIKGGGISFDPRTDQWYSRDRNGEAHAIKDPFRQALTQKHTILRQIWSNAKLRQQVKGRIPAGYAVFFTDLQELDQIITPLRPREILGGERDLENLEGWMRDVWRYWAGQESRTAHLGDGGMRLIEGIFCRPINIRPLVSAQLEKEEGIRISLTQQQALLLRTLALRNRVAISGGAGTGKTLLAVQKARMLAEKGMRTLLLCFNRPLADHLRYVMKGTPNVSAMSFHQFCSKRIDMVKEKNGRDLLEEARSEYPTGKKYSVWMPYALSLSAEELDAPFDAAVIDEAQDFRDEYWMGVELSLSDPDKSPLYIFFDHNQALYTLAPTFPIKDEPYPLTFNCRNTRQIHAATYRYFEGNKTDAPSIEGEPVECLIAPSVEAQAKRIHGLILKLLVEEQVPPKEIVILIAASKTKDIEYCKTQIFKRPLPGLVFWEDGYDPRIRGVLVETVRRFKGLEANIVFLWGIDELDPRSHREILYTGQSRAKSRLYLVGNKHSCQKFKIQPRSISPEEPGINNLAPF